MANVQSPSQGVPGYRALAAVIGPHCGLSLFKHFSVLNTHSLLLQQAELLHLESDLEAAISVDRDDGLRYDEVALDLIKSRESAESSDQWDLILKIREKLRDYSIGRSIRPTK